MHAGEALALPSHASAEVTALEYFAADQELGKPFLVLLLLGSHSFERPPRDLGLVQHLSSRILFIYHRLSILLFFLGLFLPFLLFPLPILKVI